MRHELDPPVPDPIPALKRQLAAEIRRFVEKRRWGWPGAVVRLGIDQPQAWNLLHDRLDRFSLQKLIRLLARIDHRVELHVVADPMTIFKRFPVRRRTRRALRAPDAGGGEGLVGHDV